MQKSSIKYWQIEFNNISKTYQKDQVGFIPVLQNTQIIKRNRAHQQKQRQKTHDHLKRCRKSLWYNSTSFMIKALMKLGMK
jgi:hypothetical protein